MNGLFKSSALVACGLFSLSVLPAQGAITFLDHFNSSSSFDINPANGDYAAGDSTATLNNSPTTDTGFFPGSTPANLAFKAGATSPSYVDFDGNGGNIQYTSPTSGGITLGAWLKFTGGDQTYGPYGRMITLGDPDLGDDFLMVDYGNSHEFRPRATFRDGDQWTQMEVGVVSFTDWNYVAVTVDLTNTLMTMYIYDAAGSSVGTWSQAISFGVNWGTGWNLDNSAASRVRIGGPVGAGTVWADEVSIDDQVLSVSEIDARVSSMVGGNQLAVPEPASLGLILLGGAGLLARRRRLAH